MPFARFFLSLLPGQLSIPLSHGRASLGARQWIQVVPVAIMINVLFRAMRMCGLLRPEYIDRGVEAYLRAVVWTGALDDVPFCHSDYRDLRAQLRLATLGSQSWHSPSTWPIEQSRPVVTVIGQRITR